MGVLRSWVMPEWGQIIIAKTNTCKWNILEVFTRHLLKQRCNTDFLEMNFGRGVHLIRIFLRETPVPSLPLLLGDFQQKIDGEIEVPKDILVPSIIWDSSYYPKTIAKASPAPLLHPRARRTPSLSTFPTSSWLGWAAAAKKVGDELVARDRMSSPVLPAPSLLAAWWSSCHSHLCVIRFLCPILEVASAEIPWKITLGWKPMQIYVFGLVFFFLPLCELPLI